MSWITTRAAARAFPGMLLVSALGLFTACPPPPPPPPPPPEPPANLKPEKLLPGEEGLTVGLADGGMGPLAMQADGGILTTDTPCWCNYVSTGPAGNAACFASTSHVCITCDDNGVCPQGIIGAVVPNMPSVGNPGVPGCDMKLSGSTNAHACGACDTTDYSGPGGGFGPFGGYFKR